MKTAAPPRQPTTKRRRGVIDSDQTAGALARLRGTLPSLLPAERKVAEYALKHPNKALAQSVGEVARESDVSEATVIRFCRSAGFKGFADLKIGLARELVSPLATTLHEDVSARDDPATLARKVFGANIDTLNDTLSALDPTAIDEAAKKIDAAHKILVIGVGTSSPIATDAAIKFMRLGLPVRLATDAHLMMMEAALVGKGDVIVAVSHSGMTRDPIETCIVAKKNRATIVVITSNGLAPLAKESDLALLTSSRETKFRSEALASRIAQSAIIDLLYVAIGLINPKRALKSAKKIEDVITEKQF